MDRIDLINQIASDYDGDTQTITKRSQERKKPDRLELINQLASGYDEGDALAAKKTEPKKAQAVPSQLQNTVKSLGRPKSDEGAIPADVREYMMRVNTGHAQDPTPEPGKLTYEQIRKQELAEQKRNAEEVATKRPSETKPSKDKPKYPDATIGPAKTKDPNERPNLKSDIHEVKSFLGDPGLYVKNATDKPIQQAKTIVSQATGDVGKGLTLGALDLNEGKVFGQKVLPNNAEFLQSSGVSPDIASQETTGFKVGNVVPALKGTFFDWDIHPAEWAALGPAIGAVSRGAMKYISKPAGQFLFKKAPAVLKPLIPTITRIVNSGLTGGAVNTASGLLQGQEAGQIPGNFGTGAAFGFAFGLVGEGLNTIARAPIARRANLYKQAADKMAQWAYGEGKFNSYEEAFVAADRVFQQEVAARGGLGKLRPKDLKAFNQALGNMLKKQQKGVPGDAPPMVDQAFIENVNANQTGVSPGVPPVVEPPAQPIIPPTDIRSGIVPEQPQNNVLPGGQKESIAPGNQSQETSLPGISTKPDDEADYWRSIAQDLIKRRQEKQNQAGIVPAEQPKASVQKAPGQMTPSEGEIIEAANDALYNQILDIQEQLITDEMGRVAGERQGVELIPSQGNPERKIRMSKNPPWYREFYKKYGRRPNKGELRQMAIERLTGGYESEEVGTIPPNDDFLEAVRILGELDRQKQTSKTVQPKQSKKVSANVDVGPEMSSKKATSLKLFRGDQGTLTESGKNLSSEVDFIDYIKGLRGQKPDEIKTTSEFTFYTEDEKVANDYADRDNRILESYRKRGVQNPEKVFETMHGHKPRAKGTISKQDIEVENPLDISGIG
jgi:hypothetical protein